MSSNQVKVGKSSSVENGSSQARAKHGLNTAEAEGNQKIISKDFTPRGGSKQDSESDSLQH